MSDEDEEIKVRCMSCGRDYRTSKKAFWVRGCACPDCGSSKAQDRSER